MPKAKSPLCKDSKFDAITQINGRNIYAFKGLFIEFILNTICLYTYILYITLIINYTGSNFYILNFKEPTKPRSIKRYFRGVPSNIDAVISKGEKLIFIKVFILILYFSGI